MENKSGFNELIHDKEKLRRIFQEAENYKPHTTASAIYAIVDALPVWARKDPNNNLLITLLIAFKAGIVAGNYLEIPPEPDETDESLIYRKRHGFRIRDLISQQSANQRKPCRPFHRYLPEIILVSKGQARAKKGLFFAKSSNIGKQRFQKKNQ